MAAINLPGAAARAQAANRVELLERGAGGGPDRQRSQRLGRPAHRRRGTAAYGAAKARAAQPHPDRSPCEWAPTIAATA